MDPTSSNSLRRSPRLGDTQPMANKPTAPPQPDSVSESTMIQPNVHEGHISPPMEESGSERTEPTLPADRSETEPVSVTITRRPPAHPMAPGSSVAANSAPASVPPSVEQQMKKNRSAVWKRIKIPRYLLRIFLLRHKKEQSSSLVGSPSVQGSRLEAHS